jgi:drug/metabolite transporter (DMT)-like permease
VLHNRGFNTVLSKIPLNRQDVKQLEPNLPTGDFMRRLSSRLLCLGAVILLSASPAFAALPDLPRQELYVKIISLVVGIVVVAALCIIGVSRLLLWTVRLEADLATNLSVVIAIILSFLWFLYLFGQIFDMIMKIVIGVLIFIGILMFFLREKPDRTASSRNDDTDINY